MYVISYTYTYVLCIIFLLYSSGSLFGVPTRVPFARRFAGCRVAEKELAIANLVVPCS